MNGFFEIYKDYNLLHRSDLDILAKKIILILGGMKKKKNYFTETIPMNLASLLPNFNQTLPEIRENIQKMANTVEKSESWY